jgi:hypothetical protein
VIVFLLLNELKAYKKRVDKTKCPKVKSIRNFDLHEVSTDLIRVPVPDDACKVEV